MGLWGRFSRIMSTPLPFETVEVGAYTHAVYHQLYVVGFVAVDLHVVGEFADFAVHTYPEKAFLGHLGKEFAVVAFTCFHQRGKHHDVTAAILFDDEVENLFLGIFHHSFPADVGVGNADAGIKQSDEVVNLGHRADGGTGILVGGFLFDGDDGTESGDAVHIGTFDVAYEMACIGRECFHIAALTFGVDGVEGKTRFAAAAETGENNKLVAGNVEVHILQVVLAGT